MERLPGLERGEAHALRDPRIVVPAGAAAGRVGHRNRDRTAWRCAEHHRHRNRFALRNGIRPGTEGDADCEVLDVPDGGGALGVGQGRVARIGQPHGEGLVRLIRAVVEHRYGDGPSGLAGLERERATRGGVVGSGLRDAVGGSVVDRDLFDATYRDGLTIEMQVNAEFGSREAAEPEAAKYVAYIGKIPTLLRVNVETAWIHRGDEDFGGGNSNILILPIAASSGRTETISPAAPVTTSRKRCSMRGCIGRLTRPTPRRLVG